MQTVYTIHSDPGHAWLAVSMGELVRLGIAHLITRYSYIREDVAYLEEDCDLSTWATAKAARGEAFTLVENHDAVTPIRDFARYTFNRSLAQAYVENPMPRPAWVAASVPAEADDEPLGNPAGVWACSVR